MMGPNRRASHRSVKSKIKDRDASTSEKNIDIIDLTSPKKVQTKSNLSIGSSSRSRSRKDAVTGKESGKSVSGNKGDTCSRNNNTNVEKDRSSRTEASCVSLSSAETNEEKTDRNDSIFGLDEDLLPDSQFNSQENLLLDSSQDGDQCEVRWDYTSPETMKQLKKMRGKYSAQDVKRIIANFPDVPVKPIPSTVHQFRYTFAPKTTDVLPEKNKIQKAKQRAARKMQRRERCRGAVEDMIVLLQQHQQKHEKVEAGAGTFEVSSEMVEVPAEKEGMCSPEHFDHCSEDDLFQDDNSFLIEATQNLEKLLPVVTKEPVNRKLTNLNSNSSVDSSEVSDSCDLFSTVLPGSSFINSCSKSVIPSSFAGTLGRNLFAASTKPLSYYNGCSTKAVSHTSSTASSHSLSHLNKPAPSTSSNGAKFREHFINNDVIKQQNVNQHGKNVCNRISSQGKMFQRHKTFQDELYSSKQSKKGANSSLNSPFRKCLSFDNSFNSNERANASENRKEALSTKQNMSFDSSFSDDFLLQATEVFDTVCDQTVGSTMNSRDRMNSFKCDQQHPAASKSESSDSSSEHQKDLNITNTLLSPVRPLKHESSLKRLQQPKASDSPVQSFFKKTFAIESQPVVKHKSQTGPNSTSTPVKVAKILEKEDDKLQTAKGSDSFMDDDSFMNDQALFESQILPILEMAETQITGKESKASNFPTKYSPDEIEKKRLAAIQKLRKNDCVPPLVQNEPKLTSSPEIIEATQIPSSPHKCSQEEINRKKQAAQRKLLARTNSTGSIQIPKVNASTSGSLEPHNNNVAGAREMKCSQETIKMKREEALKKRRLRLMQLPDRKS